MNRNVLTVVAAALVIATAAFSQSRGKSPSQKQHDDQLDILLGGAMDTKPSPRRPDDFTDKLARALADTLREHQQDARQQRVLVKAFEEFFPELDHWLQMNDPTGVGKVADRVTAIERSIGTDTSLLGMRVRQLEAAVGNLEIKSQVLEARLAKLEAAKKP